MSAKRRIPIRREPADPAAAGRAELEFGAPRAWLADAVSLLPHLQPQRLRHNGIHHRFAVHGAAAQAEAFVPAPDGPADFVLGQHCAEVAEAMEEVTHAFVRQQLEFLPAGRMEARCFLAAMDRVDLSQRNRRRPCGLRLGEI